MTDPNLATDTVSDQDIFENFRDIMLAGEILSEAFRRREPSMDGHSLAPFVLRDIHEAGRRGLSQVEIARRLHRSSSSATRLIDCMQRADIVQRMPHPNDRRVNMITLTEQGRTLLQDIMEGLTQDASILRALDKSGFPVLCGRASEAAKIAARNI